MKELELIIKDYIEKMEKEYNVIGGMLTGSYVTGNMRPNSDIDIFFIWNKENQSIRGKEFYKDIEFEYFISPKWKYYDRLKNDLTSQQIYSTGKIIFDSKNIFKNIQEKAIEVSQSYNPKISKSERLDYSFYIETIMKDGIDMLEDGQFENFYFLSGIHIPKFCNIIAKTKKKYPVYERYAMEQLKLLDERLFLMLMEFYKAKKEDGIYNEWVNLCKYILKELGDIDLNSYQVVSKLKRS